MAHKSSFMDMIRENKKWLYIGMAFHFIAVLFSEGYHRPDEHLAVIHMMQFKLGTFPEELLSWEYPVKIRPWLQPFIQFSISKFYTFFGFTNPFNLAFLFRLVASLSGISASVMIAFLGLDIVKNERWKKLIFPSALLISYFPFFHARATAENFGINFFIYGIFLILFQLNRKGDERNHLTLTTSFLAGMLFGISFIFRFQMGIPIFFFALWLIFNKVAFKYFLSLSLGIGSFIGLSVLIDYWGYGTWTFTPWNYLYQNIILGKVNGFGVSPFYYYLTKTFSKGVPPLSLLFIGSYLFYWYKKPKHWLTWTMLSFFIIHSVVGHKELRFIFGMGMFLPILIPFLLDHLEKKQGSDFFGRKKIKYLTYTILAINFIFLIISSTRTAFSPISFYRHVYDSEENIDEVHTLRIFRDQLPFYLKSPMKWIPATDLSQIDEKIKADPTIWFLTNNFNDILLMRSKNQCREDYIAYPNWVFKWNIGNWMERSKIWALYRCTSQSS